MRRGVCVVMLVIFAASACGSDQADRGEVLAVIADEVIVPAYQHLDRQSATLVDATVDLCAAPSDELVDAARSALAATRAAWLRTEAVWVGPVMERRSWAVVDWPITVGEIEELISDESIVLDLDRLSRRIGADQRGLQAVEYILGPSRSSPVDALGSARRCDYLVGIARVIHAELRVLPPAWTSSFEDGPAYREQFLDVVNGGLDSLVNDSLFLLEAMTDAELGTALGVMGEAPDPTAIVEGAAGLGVADLAGRTAGLRSALVGGPDDDHGIAPLLSDDLVDRLRDGLDRAESAIAGLSGPLRDRLIDDVATVIEVRDALTDVQILVATEVVSTLGVTIGFSDADGDSG